MTPLLRVCPASRVPCPVSRVPCPVCVRGLCVAIRSGTHYRQKQRVAPLSGVRRNRKTKKLGVPCIARLNVMYPTDSRLPIRATFMPNHGAHDPATDDDAVLPFSKRLVDTASFQLAIGNDPVRVLGSIQGLLDADAKAGAANPSHRRVFGPRDRLVTTHDLRNFRARIKGAARCVLCVCVCVCVCVCAWGRGCR